MDSVGDDDVKNVSSEVEILLPLYIFLISSRKMN